MSTFPWIESLPHPLNTPSQHTFSAHSFNTHSQHTLSPHSLIIHHRILPNIHSAHLLTNPINIPNRLLGKGRSQRDTLIHLLTNPINIPTYPLPGEQLKMCEQEIIKMYEYTTTTDEILDNVEKGVYKVERYQGKHGKSTTGHAATAATLNATAAASHREGWNTKGIQALLIVDLPTPRLTYPITHSLTYPLMHSLTSTLPLLLPYPTLPYRSYRSLTPPQPEKKCSRHYRSARDRRGRRRIPHCWRQGTCIVPQRIASEKPSEKRFRRHEISQKNCGKILTTERQIGRYEKMGGQKDEYVRYEFIGYGRDGNGSWKQQRRRRRSICGATFTTIVGSNRRAAATGGAAGKCNTAWTGLPRLLLSPQYLYSIYYCLYSCDN